MRHQFLRAAAGSGGALWTPAEITTELWFDADDAGTVTVSGGAVTAWSDKSGNSRTATINGNPTYSATGLSTSKPAVQLDGSGDSFRSSVTGIGSFNALDVYMVMQTSTAAAADVSSALFWSWGNLGSSPGPYPANTALALLSTTGAFAGEKITVHRLSAGLLGVLGSTTYARPANTAQMLNSRCSTSGTELYANADLVTIDRSAAMSTSTNSAPSSIGYGVDSELHFGAARSAGSLVYTPAAKFSEIIVSSALLGTPDQEKMAGYLAHKWGLAASLPGAHPYKNSAPTI